MKFKNTRASNFFRHVVEACSFFKSNVSLLSGGSASTANITSNNSIERKSRSACRTCFGLRSNCLHPPDIFARSQRELCDCSAPTEHPNRKLSSLSVATDRKQTHHRKAKLHTEELSVIGLPIYYAKRQVNIVFDLKNNSLFLVDRTSGGSRRWTASRRFASHTLQCSRAFTI